MHKAKEVIGLPVLALRSGQELGVVRDVLFDKEWNFCGLFIEGKTLFRRGRFVPSHSIHAIGEDCVTVPNDESLLPVQGTSDLNGIGTGPTSIVGKPVYTENGDCLGHVEDLYFQEAGQLMGYEISDGLLSDILSGRKTIKHSHQSVIGEDVVVTSEDLNTLYETQTLTEGEEWK